MVKKPKIKNTLKQIFYSSRVQKGYMILILVTIFPLTYKIISPFMILTGLGAYTASITGTLYAIGILLSFPHIIDTLRIKDVILYIIFALFFFISQLIYPKSEVFISKNFFDVILYVTPFYFLGLMVNYQRDQDLLRNVMRIAFIIALYWQLCILLGLVDLESQDGTLGEQMDFAYYLLIVVCYMLVEYNKSHFKFELYSLLVGSIMLLFMGARGPVVLWAFFISSYLMLFHRFRQYNAIKKSVVIILFSIFYFFSKPFIMYLALLATRLGLSTKIFDSLLGGTLVNFEESSGRDLIYDGMWAAVKSDPTGFGYGFGGDRLFSASNGYAHNFELEILVQFGYIGGSLIILALATLFTATYKRIKGSLTAEFWLVIFFWGFMSLQFSKSWLMHPGFFFMIGYCISILRTNKSDFFNFQ